MSEPSLVLDDPLRGSSWVSALGPSRRGSAGELNAASTVVEEVGERPVPDVVEQTGDAQRLDDEPFGRDRALASPPAALPAGSDRGNGPTGRPRA